jgi:hypothetical protein
MVGGFNNLTATLAPGASKATVAAAIDPLLAPYGEIGAYDRRDQSPIAFSKTSSLSSTTPISPLRRRMIEDMTVRGFGEKIQSDYIRDVKNFTIFLARKIHGGRRMQLKPLQSHRI